MHPRTSTAQAARAGDHPTSTGLDSLASDRARATRRKGLELAGTLAKTLTHFFPDLRRELRELDDTRVPWLRTYGTAFLAFMGILLFAMRLGARRRLRGELETDEALTNLNALSGCCQTSIADDGTVDHFLGHVAPGQWSGVRRRMIDRLGRMRVLDKARLLGYHPIIIDGTGQFSFERRHCEHCLEQKHEGKTLYFHNVLEAKLVTPEGLVLSIGTEFIQNSDPHATKQDCELKAFYRMAATLRRQFPQLRLCLLMDGIYAKGTVFDLCRENHWKYIVTFKRGSLPALWREYLSLRRLGPVNRKTARDGSRHFAWVPSLIHVDDRGHQHDLAAFQSYERDSKGRHRFVWLTNFQVREHQVEMLANRGGRLRFKIENEGFNIQKNGGFALEHAYSYENGKIKAYYLLLQITHILMQLVERGSLLGADAVQALDGICNLSRRLAESFRNRVIPAEALDLAVAARIQIRLNTS